jgi:DNA-directed RNA polymerase specialized sigma subunit
MDKWYRATERLLYTYPGMEVRIEALTEQLNIVKDCISPRTVGRYERVEGKMYSVGNKVERAAIERIENQEVQRLQRKIRKLKATKEIVEKSLETVLTGEEKAMVKLIYWDQLTWEEICDIMGISRYPFYTRKNKLIRKLAWCFGYLDDRSYGLKPIKNSSPAGQ